MTSTYLRGPRKGVIVMLVGVLLAQPCLMGQTIEQQPLQEEAWNRLTVAPPGSRVRLTLKDGSEIRGRLVEARADAVVLEDNETGPTGIRLSPGQSIRDRLTFFRADTASVDILSQQRSGLSTGQKIAMWVGIGVAIIAAIISECGSFSGCFGQ